MTRTLPKILTNTEKRFIRFWTEESKLVEEGMVWFCWEIHTKRGEEWDVKVLRLEQEELRTSAQTAFGG